MEKATLTEKEAAIYTGLSASTFRQSRMDGPRRGKIKPPPFIRLGRSIRYLKSDLDRWLEEHRVTFSSDEVVLKHMRRK